MGNLHAGVVSVRILAQGRGARSNTAAVTGSIFDKSDNMIIMESHISATDAARSFSDLINRVLYRGDVFVIERGGQPVCRIVPAKPAKFTLRDLAQLLKTLPKPDAGYWDVIKDIQRKQPPLPKSPWER
jgi:antitoxin (DNA-binding transcriptional repressor) of toxin-antitoxin stability system